MKNKIKNILLEIVNFAMIVVMYAGLLIILQLHKLVAFFPILFLFHLCFWVIYPLFFQYIYKKSWHSCVSDNYRRIIYILIPAIVLEMAVLLYYPKETLLACEQMGAEERVEK